MVINKTKLMYRSSSAYLCAWTAFGFTAKILDIARRPRYFTTEKKIKK